MKMPSHMKARQLTNGMAISHGKKGCEAWMTAASEVTMRTESSPAMAKKSVKATPTPMVQ